MAGFSSLAVFTRQKQPPRDQPMAHSSGDLFIPQSLPAYRQNAHLIGHANPHTPTRLACVDSPAKLNDCSCFAVDRTTLDQTGPVWHVWLAGRGDDQVSGLGHPALLFASRPSVFYLITTTILPTPASSISHCLSSLPLLYVRPESFLSSICSSYRDPWLPLHFRRSLFSSSYPN
jgi:hypothetical protein